MEPLSKEALRRTALDARKAFVATLSDAERALLEHRLAERLTSLFAGVSVVGGYCPLGSEISPLPAMEEARAVGAIAAFPCFADPAKPFRFLAGDPLEPGPFGIMQPAKRHPVVQPDLVLVPLIAIDDRGTRLGRGKGHYDRALASLKKSSRAPNRRRLAAAAPARNDPSRSLGRATRRLRQSRRRRMVRSSAASLLRKRMPLNSSGRAGSGPLGPYECSPAADRRHSGSSANAARAPAARKRHNR